MRSPDTDVFILLLRFVRHINHTVLFDTGTGDKRRLVNVQAVAKDLGHEINLALYSSAGIYWLRYDQCFCEKRESEATHIPKKKKHPEFVPAFHALGSRVDLEDRVFKDLQKFTSDLRKQVG